VVDETVDYFIERGDNYIDSRLAKRYAVPFTQSTTPPILTDISANLAAYGVLKRLRIETRDEEDDYTRTFYNDAMRTLKEIEAGKTFILDTNGDIVEPLSETGIVSSTSRYRPIFNEGEPLDWEVDDDRLSDELDSYA
jgi:phage gp36-like protein